MLCAARPKPPCCRCRGYNGYSQLGDGGTTTSVKPKKISNMTWAMLPQRGYADGSNRAHTCAVATNESLYCWYDALSSAGVS